MNPLLFRTAIPFGYVAFAVLMFIALAAGVVITLRGWRARRAGQSAVGVTIVVLVITVAWVNIAAENALELNPQFSSSAILGTWKDGAATLVLRPDGAYSCSGDIGCDGFGQGGTWARDGSFDLMFRRDPAAPATGRRIVAYRGELRLATLFEDPDLWDGRLTFRHPPSAN